MLTQSKATVQNPLLEDFPPAWQGKARRAPRVQAASACGFSRVTRQVWLVSKVKREWKEQVFLEFRWYVTGFYPLINQHGDFLTAR